MDKQLVVRPEKCVNCRTCELVCSFGHYGHFNPHESAVSVMDFEEDAISVPVMCPQCEDAPCLKVCPVSAISRSAGSAIVIDYEICIGCKKCLKACPMSNIRVSPVSRRVFKCDLCGGEPKCAAFCPTRAIEYIDIEDDHARRQTVKEHLKNIFPAEVRS